MEPLNYNKLDFTDIDEYFEADGLLAIKQEKNKKKDEISKSDNSNDYNSDSYESEKKEQMNQYYFQDNNEQYNDDDGSYVNNSQSNHEESNRSSNYQMLDPEHIRMAFQNFQLDPNFNGENSAYSQRLISSKFDNIFDIILHEIAQEK
jgi:hypothetical protein